MRILVDYRPALRARTGVGEYIHQITRAYTTAYDDEVTLFSSSWRDRLTPGVGHELGTATVDRRLPVGVLNLLWHRAGWPPVEALAGRFDVVHAAHPLLIPARHAAQVVTIHDLFFLTDPAAGPREAARDYALLAGPHARRADAVVTSTEHGRTLVVDRLGVPTAHVHVCPPSAPMWRTLGRAPHRPTDGCILFFGTLERRKNVGALLDAYAVLVRRRPDVPRLVLAGNTTPDATAWLARLQDDPLRGRAEHVGYVEDRERAYAAARVVVLPSLDEGFGLPALEAMSAGVPLIAASRGALPEVVGDGGCLVDPGDVDTLSGVLERAVTDDGWADQLARAGLERAKAFTGPATAAALHGAYADALHRYRRRTAFAIAGNGRA